MSSWNKAISWSKMVFALDCPRRLQYTLDREVISDPYPNYYSSEGKTVQKVFEFYFNEGINKTKEGRSTQTLRNVANRVLGSAWRQRLEIQYSGSQNTITFDDEIRSQVEKGRKIFEQLHVLERDNLAAEKKWTSVFRNHKIVGLMDFVTKGPSGFYIFDGKGHKKKTADPRQLLFYALIVTASGEKVAGGGFIYWQHGFERVDIDPAKVSAFVRGELEEGFTLFTKLQQGISGEMEARPKKSMCRYCSWKSKCPESPYKRERKDWDDEEVTLS